MTTLDIAITPDQYEEVLDPSEGFIVHSDEELVDITLEAEEITHVEG